MPVDIPDLNLPVTVSVSGREVLVSGFVNSQDQRACILKQMQYISGHLQITDGLVLSASLSPYVTEATKVGQVTAVIGHAPTQRARDEINGRMIVSLRHRP